MAGDAAPAGVTPDLVRAHKLAVIEALAPGVTHELSNQLTAIVAFSYLVRDDPGSSAERQRDAVLLAEEAEGARHIIGGLLDFARARPPERVPTAPAVLVRSVVDLLAFDLRKAGVAVEVDAPSSLPAVAVDRANFQLVLLTVVQRAVDAVVAGGGPRNLRIYGQAPDPAGSAAAGVRLTIATGVPVPAPEPGAAWLTVVNSIVAEHGGQFAIEAEPAGGDRFVIELPVGALGGSDKPAAAAGSASEPKGDAVSEPVPTRDPDHQRVLVLDDESSIRRFLEKALRVTGHEPIIAERSAEAIELVGNQDVDLVLCDHRMADMSGIEVYRAIVARRPDLAGHFVLMSGDILNPELVEFASVEGIGLLSKPFDLDAISAVVATWGRAAG